MGPRSIPHCCSTSALCRGHRASEPPNRARPVPAPTFSGDVIPKFDAQPTGLTSLLLFTVNAGGLAPKLPMVLTLLVDIEPVIIGVHEGGPLFGNTSLQGIRYSVVLGPHVPGGGLAILVHACLKTRQAVHKDLMDNAISTALPLSDKFPAIVSNVHFPQGMPTCSGACACCIPRRSTLGNLEESNSFLAT